MELKEVARKHALKNAFDYGRASAGAVVGKVVAEAPEAKRDMRGLGKLVAQVVAEVNELSRTAVEKEVRHYTFEQKIEEERKIRLEGAVEGKVVTRFLPEPNGYLHIGHAKAAWLNRQAADDWKGKCLLRFDDTNPETEQEEFVKAIRGDLSWLGVEFDGAEAYASDLMPKFYELAERMAGDGNAFVCECGADEVKRNREKSVECNCRGKSKKQNALDWKKMVEGKFGEGQAVLRLKGDVKALNTVMRDPTLFRIIEKRHYRQGKTYRAWPTYDFEVSIADSLAGVTHCLRSKEYELRDELYYRILELMGMRKPFVYDFARLSIKGTLLSKRFLKPLIEEKKVMGWDDPRLPTIRGLKRRGVLPQAIKEFVLGFGLSKVESEPTWEKLLSINRRLLDGKAEHFFFVAEPVELAVVKVPAEHAGEKQLSKHPQQKLGFRRVVVANSFFLAGGDAKQLVEGEVFRLKELYNVRLKKKGRELEAEFVGTDKIDGKILQWVSGEKGEAVKAKLLQAGDLVNESGGFNEKSLTEVSGYCEKECGKLEEGEVVQFERVGFCRLDDAEKKRFVLSC